MTITRSISIQKLMQFTKCHAEVENHIMRESLPYLSKIFFSDFAPLSNLDIEKIEDIISKTTTRRLHRGSLVEIPNGGILAKGYLLLTNLFVLCTLTLLTLLSLSGEINLSMVTDMQATGGFREDGVIRRSTNNRASEVN